MERLEARGVRGLEFPPDLIAEPSAQSQAAFTSLLVEVTSGDCITVTRFAYSVTGAYQASKRGPRDLDVDRSDPAGSQAICPGEGLLLPVGTFTVNLDPQERFSDDELAPFKCILEYESKTLNLLTRESCTDAFQRPVGLG